MMNKTILIIDDDEMLRTTLARGLRAENFNVLMAESAEDGRQVLDRVIPDAIVLDRMMTGKDGLSFLQDLRNSGDKTPVIMLTALSGPENAIDGLSNGANDYLAKPFQLKELVLRLHNILKNTDDQVTTLPAGLILSDGEFFVGDKIFALSAQEKDLLINLVTPIGNVVPTQPMVVKRLRTKLNAVLSGIDIVTVRGKGYKLINR